LGRARGAGSPTGSGGFQTTLGVDQKISGGDDPLPGPKPIENHVAVANAQSELNLPRLKAALSLVHEHGLSRSGIEDRGLRYRNPSAGIHNQLDVGVHVGLQSKPGIGQLDPDFQRPRLGVDLRIDVSDRSSPNFAGQRGKRDPDRLADPNVRGFILVNFRQYPNPRQVDDGVEFGFGCYPLSLEGVAGNDKSRVRG
jgi:hypothetical protein